MNGRGTNTLLSRHGRTAIYAGKNGSEVTGTQQGELYRAALEGEIYGAHVYVRSSMAVSGDFLQWSFEGTTQGDTMAGSVDLGEYGTASWTAHRV